MSSTATAYYRIYRPGQASDDRTVTVTSLAELDALIDTVLAENSWGIALYHDQRPKNPRWPTLPDHEFRIGLRAEHKVGVLRLMGMDPAGNPGTWFSKGEVSGRPKGPDEMDELIYDVAGGDMFCPLDSEIPLEQVHQAAREFLTNGGVRPTCVAWQPVSPF